MISAPGTCRLCWRLKIFFQHQLSGGEIKQIIWQAVYIFRSIRSGEGVPPCRRASDQSELSWDNPSCQSVKTAAWWDPATARIIFWISFSPSSQHYDAWLGKYHLHWHCGSTSLHSPIYILQCSECFWSVNRTDVFIKYCQDQIDSVFSLSVGSLFHCFPNHQIFHGSQSYFYYSLSFCPARYQEWWW